jgi:hypothetical protein
MALIQYGPLVTDARNKVGGVVFSKNRSGAYTRKKVSPVQPRTADQLGVRANFTALSKTFATTLTVAQVTSWNSYAASTPTKDRFGATIYLTGLNQYQKLNRNLDTIGAAKITTPPTSTTVTDIGGIALSQSSTTPYDVSATPTNNNISGETIAWYGAAPTDTGKTNVASSFRLIGTTAGPTTGAIDITAMYVGKFGNVATGKRLNIRAKNISSTTGGAGVAYAASIVLNNPIT